MLALLGTPRRLPGRPGRAEALEASRQEALRRSNEQAAPGERRVRRGALVNCFADQEACSTGEAIDICDKQWASIINGGARPARASLYEVIALLC